MQMGMFVGGNVVKGFTSRILRGDKVLDRVTYIHAAASKQRVIHSEAIRAAAIARGHVFPTVAGRVIGHAEDISFGGLLKIEARSIGAAGDAVAGTADVGPTGEHAVGGGANVQ